MTGLIVGFVAGALVGWSFPQPLWVSNLVEKVKGWLSNTSG